MSCGGSGVLQSFPCALAYSGLPWPTYTLTVLPKTLSISEARTKDSSPIYKIPDSLYFKSYKYRNILWSPFIAIAILLIAAFKFSKNPKSIEFVISLTFLLQLAGIFFFSIASEYRYMSILVFMPMVLLPMLCNKIAKHQQTDINHKA